MSIVRIPKREPNLGDFQTALELVLREHLPHGVGIAGIRKLQNHRGGKHVTVVLLDVVTSKLCRSVLHLSEVAQAVGMNVVVGGVCPDAPCTVRANPELQGVGHSSRWAFSVLGVAALNGEDANNQRALLGAFVCAAVVMWAKLTEIVISMNARNRMGVVERPNDGDHPVAAEKL